MAEGRVLLADDDAVGRYVIATMLRRAGFDVDEVDDGGEAVDAARRRPPDIAVLDVKMHVVGGFEACAQIKADPLTGHVPVLLLSATFMDAHDRVEGLEGGADGYLTQPVEAPVLAATVRALIRARALERAVSEAARQWTATFDAIGDAVALVDADGRVRRVNRSFLRLIAADYPAVVGQDLPALLPSLARDILLAPEAPQPVDLEIGGRIHLARVDIVPPARDEPRPADRVVTLSDVTAARQADHERTEALARERAISRTLQESLLPEHLPRSEHVGLEAWHVAAEQELIVGGDWYDAIETAQGLWLVIGDVAGHGVTATAQAGQLRHTLRVYAHEGYGPAEAMLALNDLVISQHGFATVLVAALDPSGRQLRLVGAGHPPPLLLRGGGCDLVEEAGGPALGIPATRYEEHPVALGPGDRLVLYTDGLIERPREHLDVGLERLCSVAGATSGLTELRRQLLDQLIDPVDLRDDVALLLAEIS